MTNTPVSPDSPITPSSPRASTTAPSPKGTLQASVERIESIRDNIVNDASQPSSLRPREIKGPVVGSKETVPSFWIALLAGEFKDGDTLYIEYSGEKYVTPCILPRQYRLCNIHRGQDGDGKEYIEVHLDDLSSKTTLYCLRGEFKNGAIHQIQVKRDKQNTILIPAESFERSYLASKNEIDFHSLNCPPLVPASPAKSAESATLEPSSSPSKLQGTIQALFNSEGPWEKFRRHLTGLANPYAIKYIRAKLEEFCSQNIDISQKQEFCKDPNLPSETKNLFQAVIDQLHTIARQNNFSLLTTAITATKQRIKEELNKKPADFIGWPELDVLFQFPEFLALPDQDYRKIMQYIEQEDNSTLREFMGELEDREVIDLKKLKRECQDKLKHDFNTLLSQIIRKKPQKKEGIVTYVNQSEEFFKDKTLSFREPLKDSFNGTIAKCIRTPTGLTFQLHDQSIVTISLPSFSLCHEKQQATRKLWTHLVNGNFESGDEFTLEHSCEIDLTNGILPGRYRLVEPKKMPGWRYGCSEVFECTLVNAATNQKMYTLIGDCNSGNAQIQIQQLESKKAFSLSIAHFEASHIGTKKEKQSYAGICASNADELVLIRDDRSESRIRMLRFAEIQQQLDAIRRDLLDKENRSLLKLLIDDFVSNQLKKISFDLLGKNPNFAKNIQQVSQKYYDDLKIQRSEESILRQLVLEANYVIHVAKVGNIDYARAMQLLEEAKKHAEKMKGKDAVFVMGNTGAGKSTAIGFLMGAKVKEKQNHVGEMVWYIKGSDKEGSEEYPKVGLSIGMSETIYAQGFQIQEGGDLEHVVFVDCPGFQDTRGVLNEICSAYSIDQAIRLTNSIRSLVVVIPANAFTTDRGNPVIELIHSIKERFPDTFKPNNSTSAPRVYLLITKTNQLKRQGEVLKQIKDGTRFEILIKELQTQIDELTKKDAQPDSFEIQALQRRLDVWKALKRMHEDQRGPQPIHRKEQISTIDLNDVLREELRKIYSARQPTTTKTNYNAALSGAFLQRKFSEIIQSSAHTWRNLILGHYVHVIPKEIADVETGISLNRKMVQEAEAEKTRKKEQAASLQAEIQTDTDFLDKLLANQNKTGKEDLDLRQQLLVEAKTHTKLQIEQNKLNLTQCNLALLNKKEELSKTETEISRLQNQRKSILEQVTNKTKEIEELKKGDKVLLLEEKKFNPEEEVLLTVWQSPASPQEALARMGSQPTDYNPSIRFTQLAKNYEGETIQVFKIEKRYRLVPSHKNEESRREFLSSHEGGGFRAKVEGLRYELIGCQPDLDGTKIAYGYKLRWIPGEPLPWIKITHIIPNHEYNAATIVNLDSDVKTRNKELGQIEGQLHGGPAFTGIEGRKKALEKEIADLNTQKNELEARIKENENTLVIEEISGRIDQTQKSIKIKKEMLAQAQDIQAIEGKIGKNNAEIAAKQEILQTLKTNLRDVAIIISTQWESAKLIRELVNLVINDNSPSADPAAKETCHDFINFFDSHQATLLTRIKQAHNF